MFKIQPSPTFWGKVPVGIPGVAKPAMLDIEFQHKKREEIQAICLRMKDNEISPQNIKTTAKEVVVGWKEVDEEFSQDALELLLENFPSAASAMVETYLKESIEAKGKI
ncbi:phage tail assembly chaperone [Candidatus Nitrotoga sp. M5]|uniref:phage tail assembly chaperone n=1 Tax=Candidatus Nitrotoga sp. M5 TaxID=2890409 RepID=UPI001EF702F9|nr:phage tail assembly chaperone [Candidatus Nitrotoga sp. M5]CAH1387019.1 conserved hypothetical protein [Candidatus Nitrotoga sp. M5]